MQRLPEHEYLEHRRRTSQEKARSAADPAIAIIHQQFADEYARRLERVAHADISESAVALVNNQPHDVAKQTP